MDSVVIKSNQYGLTLVLDPNVSFEQLITDICTKFANSRTFFGKTSMVLSIEGRELSGQEASVVIEAIQLNSDITIDLLEEKQQLKDVQMKDKIDRFYYENIYDNAKIIKGNVSKNEEITSDTSLIILGDIKAKATVRAAGNIVVLGTVSGSVHAGYPEDNSCYLVANHMEASEVSIGTTTGEVHVQNKWFKKSKKAASEPIAVVVWEHSLLAEPLHSGLVKHI